MYLKDNIAFSIHFDSKITVYRITIILERACIDRQGTDFHPECIQFHAQILVTRKLEKGTRVWKRKHKFDLARKLVSFFEYPRPCVLLPLHLFPCHLFPYPDSCQQLLVLFPTSTSDKGGGGGGAGVHRDVDRDIIKAKHRSCS